MSGSRAEIVRLARAQKGAHYVFGAYGSMPGIRRRQDQYCFPEPAGNRVNMHPNSAGPPEIIYAAETRVRVQKICAGRFRQTRLRRANVQQLQNARSEQGQSDTQLEGTRLRYPRPFDGQQVWGEDCRGIRHFDCIGLIAWLVWRVSNHAVRRKVRRWKELCDEITDFDDRDSSTYGLLRPGDILANNQGVHEHIGIVTGLNQVVHARCTQDGVVETEINVRRWDFAGALNGRYLEPAADRPIRRRRRASR